MGCAEGAAARGGAWRGGSAEEKRGRGGIAGPTKRESRAEEKRGKQSHLPTVDASAHRQAKLQQPKPGHDPDSSPPPRPSGSSKCCYSRSGCSARRRTSYRCAKTLASRSGSCAKTPVGRCGVVVLSPPVVVSSPPCGALCAARCLDSTGLAMLEASARPVSTRKPRGEVRLWCWQTVPLSTPSRLAPLAALGASCPPAATRTTGGASARAQRAPDARGQRDAQVLRRGDQRDARRRDPRDG